VAHLAKYPQLCWERRPAQFVLLLDLGWDTRRHLRKKGGRSKRGKSPPGRIVSTPTPLIALTERSSRRCFVAEAYASWWSLRQRTGGEAKYVRLRDPLKRSRRGAPRAARMKAIASFEESPCYSVPRDRNEQVRRPKFLPPLRDHQILDNYRFFLRLRLEISCRSFACRAFFKKIVSRSQNGNGSPDSVSFVSRIAPGSPRNWLLMPLATREELSPHCNSPVSTRFAPSHSRCSGLHQYRPQTRHRRLSTFRPSGLDQNFAGNSATRQMQSLPRLPVSKIRRDFCPKFSSIESPLRQQTPKYLVSGSKAAWNRPLLSIAPEKNCSAASLPRCSPFANSPSRSSGNNFSASPKAPGCGRSRPRTLQTNLAQMQFRRN